MRAAAQADLFGAVDPVLPPGIALFRGRIPLAESRVLLDDMLTVFAAAPPYRLRMKTGAYVINQLTNCGELGWHSDSQGYRYVDRHPEQGTPWPAIPPRVKAAAIAAARECGVADFDPDACLVNLYAAEGKLNLHQDHDEADFAWPIVSFSFGNDGVFALGGAKRRDPVQGVTLHHGDVMVLHGPGRMLFHGVKKIVPGTAPFQHSAIPANGRLNLTLRRAT
ncbi:Alpha-ketoglutarate-dependent dioxygenase AlkB [Alphaproteobacteria bacterium SO-S41]|nr:Alpha-ketoglutarate-dependent dioxygenase AlkB [Alphaproteobacteria bacterium SO-S41]